MVIENGIFSEALSNISALPKGLEIIDIAQATANGNYKKHFSTYADVKADPFVALNTAATQGGVFISVSKGNAVETPIHIIHVASSSENAIVNPRNLVVIEENAQAKIIESFVNVNSTAKVFNNALTEIVVGKTANVEHTKIQDETDLGYMVNTTQA